MADDNKTSFVLDLDITEFTEKGLQAKGVIDSISDSSSITDLMENLMKAAPLFATLGVAALAFKSALDLTVEGEEIKRVNDQFITLAENAGIAPSELKAGLEDAAQGLISSNDLLKIANESIVKFGSSASKLPDLLSLAMKATQVYGGSAQSNFEAISNAVANGNTRILKHYGIIIDATKAEKDFAAANGTTADQLSQVGKQQAILNATLEKGNEAFKGVEVNSKSAVSSLQIIKTTFSEIGEAFTVAFEKTIGPGVRTFLTSVQSMATQFKNVVTANFGEGTDQAAAKLVLLKQKVSDVETQIRQLQAIKGTAMDFAPGDTIAKLQTLPVILEKYKAELGAIQKTSNDLAKTEVQNETAKIAAIQKTSTESIIDLEKRKKNEQAFTKEKVNLEKQVLTQQELSIHDLSMVDTLVKKQNELLEKQHQEALMAIRNNASLDVKQKKQLEVLENQKFQEQMVLQEKNSTALRIKLLQNYASNSKDLYSGIGASFQANTLQMEQDEADMQKRGQEVWNSLQSNATSAFTQMGAEMSKGKDIASSVADAMKGFFLGFLGDYAEKRGAVMLMEGIWPPNPVAIAGGAALLALGGALKAVAGSSASSSSPTVSTPAIGGGTIGTVSSTPQVTTTNPNATAATSTAALSPVTSSAPVTTAALSATPAVASQQQAATQKTVQINIAGNYLETDQTRRMLVDLIRQESDATGFLYNQIGA